MSTKQTTQNDSNKLEQTDVFERFDKQYYVYEFDETDGTAWKEAKGIIAFVDQNAERFGYITLSNITEAEYIETTTINKESPGATPKRVYRFTAGDYTTCVDCEYVRELANDVFHVSYDQMKEHAKTIKRRDR